MGMKQIVLATALLAGAMGGGFSLGPTRGSNTNIPPAPPGTDDQRTMFKQPARLNKKQKAKRRNS